MLDSDAHLIFVNKTPYRVWSGVSSFRTEDFLRGFDALYHLQMARLLEPNLEGENSSRASLGIRTVHGLASEALFALLFSVLQAPDAPDAWFLLYQPGDLKELILRLERGESLPCRLDLAVTSWHEVAKALIPVNDSDVPGETPVRWFGECWARLAADFRSDLAKSEFNALKHGFRARAASPYFVMGGHHVQSAEHGSWFPLLNRRESEVVLSFGCRSWSARSLLAELELISASLLNLLALLKQLHGLEEHLELEIPSADVFEAAKPPKSQVLESMALTTNWPNATPVRLERKKALALYERLGKLKLEKR